MNTEQIQKLSVGDYVVDCRFKRLKVVEIIVETKQNGDVWDKSLTLEDGGMCSARYCCEIPEVEIDNQPKPH